MGSLCFNSSDNNAANEIKTHFKDMRGQYNNYKDFSSFDLNISRKIKLDNDFEIEGTFVDKKGKSQFNGKVNKRNISIEISTAQGDDNNAEYVYEGEIDDNSKKYIGNYYDKAQKKAFGKFWIEVIENNF